MRCARVGLAAPSVRSRLLDTWSIHADYSRVGSIVPLLMKLRLGLHEAAIELIVARISGDNESWRVHSRTLVSSGCV